MKKIMTMILFLFLIIITVSCGKEDNSTIAPEPEAIKNDSGIALTPPEQVIDKEPSIEQAEEDTTLDEPDGELATESTPMKITISGFDYVTGITHNEVVNNSEFDIFLAAANPDNLKKTEDPNVVGGYFTVYIYHDVELITYIVPMYAEADYSYILINDQWYLGDKNIYNTLMSYFPIFNWENVRPTYGIEFTGKSLRSGGAALHFPADSPRVNENDEETDIVYQKLINLEPTKTNPNIVDFKQYNISLYVFYFDDVTEPSTYKVYNIDNKIYVALVESDGTQNPKVLKWYEADVDFYNDILQMIEVALN